MQGRPCIRSGSLVILGNSCADLSSSVGSIAANVSFVSAHRPRTRPVLTEFDDPAPSPPYSAIAESMREGPGTILDAMSILEWSCNPGWQPSDAERHLRPASATPSSPSSRWSAAMTAVSGSCARISSAPARAGEEVVLAWQFAGEKLRAATAMAVPAARQCARCPHAQRPLARRARMLEQPASAP